jgi:uncharacterized protein (DUF4415 family)
MRGDAMKPKPIKGRQGVVRYRREPGTPLTKREKAEVGALARKPESEIDTSDIPEWTEEMWKRAVRGKFYRPVKRAVSLRLDSDVIAWLKKDGKGYQTRANRVLREKMLADKAS